MRRTQFVTEAEVVIARPGKQVEKARDMTKQEAEVSFGRAGRLLVQWKQQAARCADPAARAWRVRPPGGPPLPALVRDGDRPWPGDRRPTCIPSARHARLFPAHGNTFPPPSTWHAWQEACTGIATCWLLAWQTRRRHLRRCAQGAWTTATGEVSSVLQAVHGSACIKLGAPCSNAHGVVSKAACRAANFHAVSCCHTPHPARAPSCRADFRWLGGRLGAG